MSRPPPPGTPDAIIHDVCYDFYGQRVATCSSDQMIRVFDARSGNKQAEWRAHTGSIHRLSWAHPEFGVALASCSFDRKICIWEETMDSEEVAVAGSPVRMTPWFKAAEISDARDTVVDVQFAPHHMGVRLASCGADGMVRVHEAADVLDLTKWDLHSEMDVSAAAAESTAEVRDARANAVAQHAMTSAAERGGSGPLMGTARMPTTNSTQQLPVRPGEGGGGIGGGQSGGSAGIGSGGLGVSSDSLSLGGVGGPDSGHTAEPLCLAWSMSISDAPMIAVGVADGGVQLWRFEERRDAWTRTRAFEAAFPGGRCHADCVCSISWAADMGRSYQLLATGSRDKTVKLWALQRAASLSCTPKCETAAATTSGKSSTHKTESVEFSAKSERGTIPAPRPRKSALGRSSGCSQQSAHAWITCVHSST